MKPLRSGGFAFSLWSPKHGSYWSFIGRTNVIHQPWVSKGMIRDTSTHSSIWIKGVQRSDQKISEMRC